MAIAGIDVGSTGCKCTVCSHSGIVMKEAYREYDMQKNHGGRELDPWEVWKEVKAATAEAVSGIKEKIYAIGVTSFGETSIFVGENDKPLMNALLYIDPRGEEQCKKLVEYFGENYFNEVTGMQPQSMYSISKLMWVTENCPDIYKKTKRICQFGDYIVYLLCREAQIDYSLACRSMAFDYRKLEWKEEILKFAGIDLNKMSKPVPTGSKAGRVRGELAKELGLSEDTIIVTGCHDQIAAAIGTGCLQKGMAVDGTGTVECITPVFEEPRFPKAMYKNNYVMVPYVMPSSYVTYAFSFNGGSLLKWYRDQIAPLEAQVYKKCGKSPYDGFNAQMRTQDPSGLLVLPYFSGSATPYMDGDACGAILGIRDDTTSIDIYQGLMEGVTFEMRFNLECLAEAGIQVEELRATGGGAQAELWLQMKADILNKKIVTLGSAQSGTLGCIMMAGTACGIYEDLETAAQIFVKPGKLYLPNTERHQRYEDYYQKYKRVYAAVSAVYAKG